MQLKLKFNLKVEIVGYARILKPNIVLARIFSSIFHKHMWEQEKHHLKEFEKLIPKYRVRPTILLPLWNIAGLVSFFMVSLFVKSD